MRQLLVAQARPGAVLHVDGADHHYLVRVLRLAPGAAIAVADAAGRRARATILDVTGDRVRLRVDAERGATAGHATAPGAVILVQALPKGTLMDRVVRQATELGVVRIVPVVAERTQGRADPAAQQRRRQRWQRIARQAAQQSGSAPPPIDAPVPVRRYLERAPQHGLGLLFQPGAALLHAGAPARAAGAVPVAIRCAVGPEGGFSAAEQALFREHGFHAAGLPGGILRVDTAAVAALTAARQLLAAPRAR